jgi:hypothetical protein
MLLIAQVTHASSLGALSRSFDCHFHSLEQGFDPVQQLFWNIGNDVIPVRELIARRSDQQNRLLRIVAFDPLAEFERHVRLPTGIHNDQIESTGFTPASRLL